MTSPEGSLAAPKKSGLFEDLIEVLYAPSKVFDRTRAVKAGKYVVVTALAVVIVGLGFWLPAPLYELVQQSAQIIGGVP